MASPRTELGSIGDIESALRASNGKLPLRAEVRKISGLVRPLQLQAVGPTDADSIFREVASCDVSAFN